MATAVRPGDNSMLRRLPANERACLRPLGETFDLVFGDRLCEAGDRIAYAVFPLSGMVSLLAPADGHAGLEMGLVGYEGMFGVPLALGVTESHVRAVVQGDGRAIRFRAAPLSRALPQCPVLRARLHRYCWRQMAQMNRTAVCNAFHSIEARTARWMLSSADRMRSDGFTLTQALLADMLGVRRPAVSHAAKALAKAGLVRYARGEVVVVDRAGLEAAACDCYRIIDDLYRG